MNKVILIGGGSASGKSTVARKLQLELGDVTLFSIDNYCISDPNLSLEERSKQNYDLPSAYDGRLASFDLAKLKGNEEAIIPVYDFAGHIRSKDKRLVKPSKYIIVDSLFALYYPEILALSDLNIFIECPEDLRLERRIRRDVLERGRTAEFAKQQFLDKVAPMHDKYVEPTKKNADIIYDGSSREEPIKIDVSELKAAIENIGKKD
ncbi:MAG: uridine kinase [Bacilli bacterium]|nr:uridine kinase [Bacilli bacterium]